LCAGIVDQHVEPAVARHDVGHQLLAGLRLHEVGAEVIRGGSLDDVVIGDAEPVSRQPGGDHRADAAQCAGHQRRLLLCHHPSPLVEPCHQFGAVAHPDGLHQPGAVRLDGTSRQPQLGGDLGAGAALRHQHQDLALPAGQHVLGRQDAALHRLEAVDRFGKRIVRRVWSGHAPGTTACCHPCVASPRSSK
jgi:hypothetical protein